MNVEPLAVMCCCHSYSYSENYLVRWGSRGFPKEIEMLNNLKVVFTVSVQSILVSRLTHTEERNLEMKPVSWSGWSMAFSVLCAEKQSRPPEEALSGWIFSFPFPSSLLIHIFLYKVLMHTQKTHVEHYINKHKPPSAKMP